jgi:hypothetical protein
MLRKMPFFETFISPKNDSSFSGKTQVPTVGIQIMALRLTEPFKLQTSTSPVIKWHLNNGLFVRYSDAIRLTDK